MNTKRAVIIMDFEIDNITVRKLLMSNSVDNIFNINLRNNSNLLDSPVISLINTLLIDSDVIESYKDNNKWLTTKLKRAPLEIVNLYSERKL